MGRLAQALSKAKRADTHSSSAIDLARVLRQDYSADIEEMLQSQIEALQKQLAEVQFRQQMEMERQKVALVEHVTNQVVFCVDAAVEKRPVPAPTIIHQTPQITQVVETERVVEKAPTPLVSMKVEGGEDNLIDTVKTNKGVFRVKRDKGGYIVGIQRA